MFVYDKIYNLKKKNTHQQQQINITWKKNKPDCEASPCERNEERWIISWAICHGLNNGSRNCAGTDIDTIVSSIQIHSRFVSEFKGIKPCLVYKEKRPEKRGQREESKGHVFRK